MIDSYFITENTNRKKIVSGYSKKGKLFTTETIFYNRFHQPYKKEIWIANSDGSDHFETTLIPHLSLFGSLNLIEHDYDI